MSEPHEGFVAAYLADSVATMTAFAADPLRDRLAVVLEGGHGEVFMQPFTAVPFVATGDLASLPPAGAEARLDGARPVGNGVRFLGVEGDEALMGKKLRKDEGQGKETFVSLLGIEQARTRCGMLVDQAIAHLHTYGAQADLLREIARFVLQRDH